MQENEIVKVNFQHVVIVNGRGVEQLRVTFRKIEFYIDSAWDSAASCTRQWPVGPVASVRTGPDPGSQDLFWPGLEAVSCWRMTAVTITTTWGSQRLRVERYQDSP